MALALAESLLAHQPLNPADLAQRFVAWYHSNPPDIGIHTSSVLARIDKGETWQQAVETVQRVKPDSAGNGSVMRCWPVALTYHNNLDLLLTDSRLQSRVTHPHQDCQAGSAFINAAIYHLLRGRPHEEAIGHALNDAEVPAALRALIEATAAGATHTSREDLVNTGWVRHTLESAIWGLLTTSSFEEAVVAVVNLGNDADTAGAVVGMLAGAAYGLSNIPQRWLNQLWGQWPVGSDTRWHTDDLIALADRLAEAADTQVERTEKKVHPTAS
jgi:ADP-ribosyl-[dinitrogen reductase] hydrolase